MPRKKQHAEPRTLVVDASYLCHKAKHATGGLSFEEMGSTGIVFGVLRQIVTLSLKFQTNRIVFCWDSRHSYRKRHYAGYKDKSKDYKSEEDKTYDMHAFNQFKLLRRHVLPAIGWKNHFIQPGLEADDIIARIAFGKLGRFIIVTADEDLLQLLVPGVSWYKPATRTQPEKHHTRKTFKQEYGILPSQWVKVKQIGGCTSDKVPGITGVGESTAVKYLRGELPKHHKTYEAIESAEGQEQILFNELLVRLPHPKSTEPEFVSDRLSLEGFTKACDRLGFSSFTAAGDLNDKWKRILTGDFESHGRTTKERGKKVRSVKRRRGA